MYRYYLVDVYSTSNNEFLYSSSLLNKKSMLRLVEIFSNDYSDLNITIKVTTYNYSEPKWYLEE